MFNTPKTKTCFKNLLGWKDHYDLNEIPSLPKTLSKSESKEYYQDYHPALRLDLIKACIPPNQTIEEFLTEQTENGIVQLLNQIISERKFQGYSKETLATETLLHGYGWAKDKIINEGRFVGFRITPTSKPGLNIQLKSIGFQFDSPQTDLDIYIYHSSKLNPVHSFKITIEKALEWKWTNEEYNFHAQTNEYSGGSFIIGYYQDDLKGHAINFTDFNWKVGPCGSCDGGYKKRRWKKFNEYASVLPVYVPTASLNNERNSFDYRDSIIDYDKSYGLNIKISAQCDLTTFFCDHRYSLKQALALKVTYLILKVMQFSQQINSIEENLKMMIIRDLEGDKDTNYINIADQLKQEIKSVNFDHEGLAQPCLPCDNKNAPTYGVV